MAELSDAEYEAKLGAFAAKHSTQMKAADTRTQQLNAARGTPAQAYTNNKQWAEDQVNPPGNVETALRGGASGFLMGFEPQLYGGLKGAIMPGTTMDAEIEREKARNEQAWQGNKPLYGAGYGAGAVGLGALTAGVGNAIQGTRIGAQAVPYALKADLAKDALSEGVKGAANYLGKSAISLPTTGKALQGTAGYIGNEMNQPSNGNAPAAPVNVKGTPLSQNESSPGQFATLANFLAQAKESANPDVLAAAEQAQQMIDPNDPDAKRKMAMLLQGTPEGRAVGNADSSLNQEA